MRWEEKGHATCVDQPEDLLEVPVRNARLGNPRIAADGGEELLEVQLTGRILVVPKA